ncbi:MAG: type II secretion system F family protein [Planctomycetes bacterium]|nr:type II secretion system F family protein [Planctomycetota bacterium]
MAEFAYRARDARGGVSSGVLTATDQEDAVRQLRQQGLTVQSVNLRAASSGLGALAKIQIGKPRVKASDVVYFANQLAVMIDTGVPLPEALEALAQQAPNPTFREVLMSVAADVESGQGFSEALQKHPKQFNSMFVSLVRAGESSGNLGLMLTSVADYLVEAEETRRRIKGALAYPMFMGGLAVVVVIVLMAFVLPRFTKIYANKGAVLPTPTRVLMAVSDFCVAYWIPLIITAVVLGAGAVAFFMQPVGRRFLDTVKIRLPAIKEVCLKLYIARSFRALGTMVTAGVPVIEALEIARQTATNVHFQEVFDHAVAKVSEGETLSDQFFCTNLIPITTSQMVFAGEKSGRLGEVLLKVCGFCDRDLKDAVKKMTTLLEPAMIAFMGIFVGGVAIALLLPMFNISKVLAK